MATSRNDRRKAAKARLLAKSTRIAKASLATQLDATRDRVQVNKYERTSVTLDATGATTGGNGYYPQSIFGRLGNSAPRFLSSGRGTGAMSKRGTLALKARGLI